MPDPTGTQWIAAGLAAALVVLIGGSCIVLPAVRRGTRIASSRIAGWLLACIAMALVVVSAVLVGAGIRASMIDEADLAAGENLPSGPFIRHLFDPSLVTTEHVAMWGPLLLLPLAATFIVLALALVDRVRSFGLRAVAAGACGVVAILAGYVALGTTTPFTTDPGPLAGRAATAIAVLALATLLAVAIDLYSGSSRSSSDTIRSQRSLQSSQR